MGRKLSGRGWRKKRKKEKDKINEEKVIKGEKKEQRQKGKRN